MNRFFISVSLTQRSGIFCFCFWFSLVILLCVSFFFFSYFTDVFNSSMWTDLQAAVPQDDDVLSSLANSLPDVALAARAPSTSSKYSTTYIRWKSWAQDHGLPAFPASPFHFALYLRHLMSEAK